MVGEGTEAARGFEAVDAAGEAEIHQHEVGAEVRGLGECAFAAVGLGELEAKSGASMSTITARLVALSSTIRIRRRAPA